MKINRLLILFVLLSTGLYSQTIPERLDSPDYSVRVNVLFEIKDNNLTEYIDALVERTFEQPRLYLTHLFVDVLFRLGYEESESIIYQFIDICDQYPQNLRFITSLKLPKCSYRLMTSVL